MKISQKTISFQPPPPVKNWNIIEFQASRGEHIYIDIDRALKINPDLKKIAFVFFMGMGDYFYATNFLESIKQKYPQLEFEAFVSKNTDTNNSPLVAKLLEKNPLFSKVMQFDGKVNPINWINYDYSDCYSKIDNDTLLCPLIYEFEERVPSRYRTLCDTFNIEPSSITPYPIIYDYEATEKVKLKFAEIKETYAKYNPQTVTFVQLTSRSSSYSYPAKKELIQRLLDDNHLVVSVEKTDIEHPLYFEIDIKKFDINDSIKLLRLLKDNFDNTYCLTLVSLFWAISSGLGIKNLGMQHYYDDMMKSVYFPNLFVITPKIYKAIPLSNTFIATQNDYKEEPSDKTGVSWTYSPDFVMDCYKKMIKL